MNSPLKIGDSYEDLKRKMIYHSNSRQIESDSQNQNNSVSNSVNNDGLENVRNKLLSMTPPSSRPSSRPSSANTRKVIPLTSIGINDSSDNERVESETNGMSNVSSAHTAAKNYVLNLLNIATSTNHGDNIYSSIPNTSVNENVAISNGSGNVMVTGIALSSRKSSRNEHNHISLSDAMLSQE
jgi:hypothetical protein